MKLDSQQEGRCKESWGDEPKSRIGLVPFGSLGSTILSDVCAFLELIADNTRPSDICSIDGQKKRKRSVSIAPPFEPLG
jgi:hypothetical protein